MGLYTVQHCEGGDGFLPAADELDFGSLSYQASMTDEPTLALSQRHLCWWRGVEEQQLGYRNKPREREDEASLERQRSSWWWMVSPVA